MDNILKTLFVIKRQIHDKAIYPHNSGIDPYVSLKIVDAVIDAEIKKNYKKIGEKKNEK